MRLIGAAADVRPPARAGACCKEARGPPVGARREGHPQAIERPRARARSLLIASIRVSTGVRLFFKFIIGLYGVGTLPFGDNVSPLICSEEEELEVADEEEEGEGGSAYQRQRVDRGKGRGMSSKKRAASIAGRRRRATSAKQQNRVYDPGITG